MSPELYPLIDLYTNHSGKVSDKWSNYLHVYDRLFESYRYRNINLLEIGIQNGGSLEIWSKYFHNFNRLIGCDIDPKCANLSYSDENISVVVGDANTDESEKQITQIQNTFDIIIDDGSHKSSDIIKSFVKYFKYLNDDGIFVAEDLHCSYWASYEGGLSYPYSSLAFFKRLTDIINHQHWGVEKDRDWILQGFFKVYDVSIDDELLQQIHSVEFINSICVIRKKPAMYNDLGSRFIAGNDEKVAQGHHNLHGTPPFLIDQSMNQWTVSDSGVVEKEVPKGITVSGGNFVIKT
jgi:hypothetical protein